VRRVCRAEPGSPRPVSAWPIHGSSASWSPNTPLPPNLTLAAYLDGLAAGIARRNQALAAHYRKDRLPEASVGQPPAGPGTRGR